jgi:hypothetical protein
MKTTYEITIESIVHGRIEELTITVRSIGKVMQKYANHGWIIISHNKTGGKNG